MKLVELDPEQVLEAIKGYSNELDPETKTLDTFYRQFTCQCCGNSMLQREYHGGPSGGHAFADKNYLTARALLRCPICTWLFDPHSGLVVERGDRDKASPVPIINPR